MSAKHPRRRGDYPAAKPPFAAPDAKFNTPAVNQALYFEQVKGSEFPLAINTFGSFQRLNMALGCENLEELAGRLSELVKPEMPVGFMDKIRKGMDLLKLGSYTPKIRSGSGLCQQVVHTDDADLTRLPLIQCWPKDGGKYITFGQVVTKHPETGARNLGMYRVQLFDKKLTAMHWHMHHDGAHHFAPGPNSANPARLPSRSAAKACCPMPPPRPCPRESTNFFWPVFSWAAA